MDLSKAFDCIPHELLIAKMDAYGPILLNLFINDLFMYIKNSDLHNAVDDNTISVLLCFLPFLILKLGHLANLKGSGLEIIP